MDIELRALELACSKLCHDVISPIGAVNNGLELLEEEDDAALKVEAAGLAQRSARRASILLQVYRSAFGNAGNQASFGPREAVALVQELLSAGKVQLGAPNVPETAQFPAGYGKLAINMLVLGSDALPRGGNVDFAVMSPQLGRGSIEVTSSGQQIAWSQEFAKAILRQVTPDELSAHNILPYMCAMFAQRLGLRLSADQQGPGILRILATSN